MAVQAATVLDQAGPDGLILPAQLVGMAGFGALVSWQIPGVVGEARSVGRRAWVGATLGVGFALLGVGIFWVLIGGIWGP